jgi:hypothetical protein
MGPSALVDCTLVGSETYAGPYTRWGAWDKAASSHDITLEQLLFNVGNDNSSGQLKIFACSKASNKSGVMVVDVLRCVGYGLRITEVSNSSLGMNVFSVIRSGNRAVRVTTDGDVSVSWMYSGAI